MSGELSRRNSKVRRDRLKIKGLKWEEVVDIRKSWE